MAINELRALEMFAKSAELGSLRRAALAQGVTPQAASQTVAQLEEHLGTRLLHRTTRSLSLTDEGRQLLEAARPALDALGRALQSARSSKDTMAGPLRIVGPRSSFASVIWPTLDGFCSQHPDVQPDVQLDDGIGNWVLDRVDVGFRIGAPPEDGLIARPLFKVQLLICAAPSYIERFGRPASLDALSEHRCSVFRHPTSGQTFPWFVNIDGETTERHVPPTLSTNDTELELQAVLTGQVIAQVAAISAAHLVRAGRLVPLFPQHMADNMRLFLYYGSRRTQPQRVRQFIQFAVKRLADSPLHVLSPQELVAAAEFGRSPKPSPPRRSSKAD